MLGTWPLAISAYNHGRAGMARAVASVGTTDLVQIIQRYDGPAFKFASRNFYTAFLAALEIDSNPDRYFPNLKVADPADSATITASSRCATSALRLRSRSIAMSAFDRSCCLSAAW